MVEILFNIVMIVFVVVLLFVILGLYSKIANIRVTHLGKDVMRPNDLEDAAKGIARGSVKLAKGAKNVSLKVFDSLKSKNELNKLSTLVELKEKGAITEREFEILKKDILKKIE